MSSLATDNFNTGVKKRAIRDWICYHDPVRMGYSAEEASPRSVVTRKRLRPEGLLNDRIWLLAKNLQGDKYFVHGYFHVTRCRIERSGRRDRTRPMIIEGDHGLRFGRKVRIDGTDWFRLYKDEMHGLSLGLQSIKTPHIVKALVALLREHRLVRSY